ncbi:hypothetical protein EV702DRAFT_1045518 [Suillus placidus]|uniref:KOW domain-containing protein n=1 Tax=Suillus placidus TaxID=48579 RepID=A0A9P7D2I6_9AGAM|nr:hypothetical protein EV702DRAFT_1045518 [Suillus placidus]
MVDIVNQSCDLEAPTNTSTSNDFLMKGDHIVITEGFYGGKFGMVSKVDMLTRTLAFFSDSLNHHIWVLLAIPFKLLEATHSLHWGRHAVKRGHGVYKFGNSY